MQKSCAVIPQKRNSKGELVDSKLFLDLYKMFNKDRQATVSAYLKIKSEGFQSLFGDKIDLDENGEPTLSSILREDKQELLLKKSTSVESVAKEEGFSKNGKPVVVKRTLESTQKTLDKAIEFNDSSEYNDSLVAVPFEESSEDGAVIGIRLEERTPETTTKANKMKANKTLNDRLMQILADNGLSVGSLTALEEKMGIDGLVDFSGAETIAEGLKTVIRIASGEKGMMALPEEFSHVIIEAMKSDPLMQRLIKSMMETKAYKEVLGDQLEEYERAYSGNPETLAVEALGKILAQQLQSENAETVPTKVPRNLLSRLIQAIKNAFSRITTSDIDKAITEAKFEMQSIASNIMNRGMQITFSQGSPSEILYSIGSVSDRIERDRNILKKAIKNELKKLKIYERNTKNTTYSTSQTFYINKLRKKISEGNETEAELMYLQKCLGEMTSLIQRVKNINTLSTIQEKAKLLSQIKSWWDSYKVPLELLQRASLQEEDENDDRYSKVRDTEASGFPEIDMHALINEVVKSHNKLMIAYKEASLPLFIEFLKPYCGEYIEIPFGRWKGKHTVEDIVRKANGDISLIDMWLKSMGTANDPLLRLVDHAVKHTREKARRKTLDIQHKIQAAAKKLREAGITDFEFMYEKDDKGNITGYYIDKYDWVQYKKDRDAFFTELNERYARLERSTSATLSALRSMKGKEIKEWYDTHSEQDPSKPGKTFPKLSLYSNSKFTNMTDAQKEFYNTFMEIKKALDALLPEGMMNDTDTIKIRRDLLERVKASGTSEIGSAIKEAFIKNSDDTEFGTQRAISGFNNEEVMSLPIYYTHFKEGEPISNLSLDAVSTLIAYADMANNFNEMLQVIDLLEIGKEIISDPTQRTIEVYKGDTKIEEVYQIAKDKVRSALLKNNQTSYIKARLDKFFNMQVYQRYIADEGSVDKVSIAKLTDNLIAYTAYSRLGFNFISNITNILTGINFTRIETASQQFYKWKDMVKADNIYKNLLPSALVNLGRRIKTDKLSLFDELFDVMQDFDTEVKDKDWDKGVLAKIFSPELLFIGQNGGEHFLQNRMAIAYALNYKMKDDKGNLTNLWESLEEVEIDKDHPERGKKLVVKEGFTKEDGTAFTDNDVFKVKRALAGINQGIHGIYNREDRAAAQATSVGRLVFLFRKYLIPNLHKMWGTANYNFDTDTAQEGYFRTYGRYLKNLFTNQYNESILNEIRHLNDLSDMERQNIYRTRMQIVEFFILALLVAFFNGHSTTDKDKKTPWALRMIELQVRRQYAEFGALTPNTQMMKEGKKIITNPSAAMTSFEDLVGLLDVVNPWAYSEKNRLKGGKYKGKTRAYKNASEAIPVIPSLEKFIDPNETIGYYKKGGK